MGKIVDVMYVVVDIIIIYFHVASQLNLKHLIAQFVI